MQKQPALMLEHTGTICFPQMPVSRWQLRDTGLQSMRHTFDVLLWEQHWNFCGFTTLSTDQFLRWRWIDSPVNSSIVFPSCSESVTATTQTWPYFSRLTVHDGMRCATGWLWLDEEDEVTTGHARRNLTTMPAQTWWRWRNWQRVSKGGHM